jgi:hypothetical protein
MVARMFRNPFLAALGALALALSACGPSPRASASADIARFLDAVRRDDHTAFLAGVNRAEVQSDLRAQVTALARLKGVDVDGGPSEFAIDRMISPDTFHLVDAGTGQPLTVSPTPAQVAQMLKVRNATHVCLDDAATHACRITFAKRDGGWLLVGMPVSNPRIAVPPPAKP